MNVRQVASQPTKKYSGKKIIKLSLDNPTEIICEIKSTKASPEKSVAISVADRSFLIITNN